MSNSNRRAAILWTAATVAAYLAGCGSGSTGSGSNSTNSTRARSNSPNSNGARSTPESAPVLTKPTAASPSPTKPSGDTMVRLQNIAFHPAHLTIKAGSIVTWKWLDSDIDTAHNVTSLPGGLQFKPSGTRLTGVYSIRFQKPGKYFYECTIHPASMQGEIVVQ